VPMSGPTTGSAECRKRVKTAVIATQQFPALPRRRSLIDSLRLDAGRANDLAPLRGPPPGGQGAQRSLQVRRSCADHVRRASASTSIAGMVLRRRELAVWTPFRNSAPQQYRPYARVKRLINYISELPTGRAEVHFFSGSDHAIGGQASKHSSTCLAGCDLYASEPLGGCHEARS
jgi:hypothetical protein